jgi:hypothetical protein
MEFVFKEGVGKIFSVGREVRLCADLSRLAEIRDSTLSAIGSCDGTLEAGNVPGSFPARMEFKVVLPLELLLALAPCKTTEPARDFPFGFPLGEILKYEW